MKNTDFLPIEKQKEKLLKNMYLFLLLSSLLSLTFFTLVSYKYRFHSDAATAAMIALEQTRTGALYVKNWYYSQDFWPMFVFNGVVLLQPIVDNAFLATQIPVLLQTVIIFFLSFNILKIFSKNRLNYLLLAFLFSGVSNLWSEFFFGQGQYGNVLMWTLLGLVFLIKAQLHLNASRNKLYFFGLFLINTYINTTSIRYVPLFSGAAILSLIFLYVVDLEKATKNKPLLFLIINLTISTVLGQLIFSYLKLNYHFVSGVNGSTLVDYDVMLHENLPRLIHGLFGLMTDSGVGSPLASLKGIVFSYKFFMSLILFGLPFCAVKKMIASFTKKQLTFPQQFLLIFTMIQLLISLFSVLFIQTIINHIAAARYMMLPIFICMLLVPFLFDKFQMSLNKQFLICIGVLPLIFSNIYLLNKDNFSAPPQKAQLASFLLSNGLTHGYATFWNADSLTVISNYKVKVYHITDTKLEPSLYMSSPFFYSQPDAKENFLLLTDEEVGKFDFETIKAHIGEPIKTLSFQGYKIFVYDKLFFNKMPNWANL